MFVASFMNDNNQIYPLAFGIGDNENDASWEWFLTKLRDSIGNVTNLVFISYHNRSIKKGVATVFPDASHNICMYHLGQNLRSNFEEVDIHKIFVHAAKLYCVF